MQPHHDRAPWQQTPPAPWNVPRPRPRGSAGHTALLWIIFVLLLINLCLTIYVFGVVHHIVSAANSVGDLFD